MATRPNNSNPNKKFSSINFNDIFDKKTTPTATTTSSSKPKTIPSSTPSSSASYKSHYAHHGRMLLLSRSPAAAPSSPHPIQHPCLVPDRGQPDGELIPLRPLGSTGPVYPLLSPPPSSSPLPLPSKTDKFVPPHLRPGFMGKEESPEEPAGRPKSGGNDKGRAPDPSMPGVG